MKLMLKHELAVIYTWDVTNVSTADKAAMDALWLDIQRAIDDIQSSLTEEGGPTSAYVDQ